MAQNAFGFPEPRINDVSINRAFGAPLQAAGNLSYLDFIAVVKLLWENIHPDIPVKPNHGGSYASFPAIIYGLEIRKPHTVEPKPRSRQVVENDHMIFGQRFQNVVSFTIITKADRASSESNLGEGRYVGAEVADALAEVFEDFMLEYTPVFKRLGASELVYARRLADSEETRSNIDIIKRTVTYLLTTEKLIQTSVSVIEKVALDVRTAMSYEANLIISRQEELFNKSTPDYNNTPILIVDLNSATPSVSASLPYPI
jgi:hypothetical protein